MLNIIGVEGTGLLRSMKLPEILGKKSGLGDIISFHLTTLTKRLLKFSANKLKPILRAAVLAKCCSWADLREPNRSTNALSSTSVNFAGLDFSWLVL